jgi:hypothetical protein
VNPLDHFAVQDGRLRFRNLGEEAGLGKANGYDVSWSDFDNATGEEASGGWFHLSVDPPLVIPESAAAYLAVRIRTRSEKHPAWNHPVTVFLRRAGEWEVVGIERGP